MLQIMSYGESDEDDEETKEKSDDVTAGEKKENEEMHLHLAPLPKKQMSTDMQVCATPEAAPPVRSLLLITFDNYFGSMFSYP